MNHVLVNVVAALAFWWLGMVIAISFVEAPLKFRAPGVTIPLGLGIGRIVFRALNIIESVVAVAVVVLLAVAHPIPVVIVPAAVVVVLLAAQLGVVRPRLNRRSDQVLAGHGTDRRSRAHWAYVALETVKALGLLALGVLALAA